MGGCKGGLTPPHLLFTMGYEFYAVYLSSTAQNLTWTIGVYASGVIWYGKCYAATLAILLTMNILEFGCFGGGFGGRGWLFKEEAGRNPLSAEKHWAWTITSTMDRRSIREIMYALLALVHALQKIYVSQDSTGLRCRCPVLEEHVQSVIHHHSQNSTLALHRNFLPFCTLAEC